MVPGQAVDRSQIKLRAQIKAAEKEQEDALAAMAELSSKLAESHARLARLRKQKDYVDKKAHAQSVALDKELDREEAEEAARLVASSSNADSVAPPPSGSLAPGVDFNDFLDLQ